MKKLILAIIFFALSQINGSSQPCLPQGIKFTSQTEVDNFHFNYPDCNTILGPVEIYGTDINNLQGLGSIRTIKGGFLIMDNNLLPNLYGLDHLDSIYGGLAIVSNDILTSLEGLRNLKSIGGSLQVVWNHSLKSLSGIDKIDAGSITSLYIYFNDSLTVCEVESICNYLVSPGTTVYLHSNNAGCNSIEEVKDSCKTVGLGEIDLKSLFSIFPNPAKDKVFISTSEGSEISEVVIYNHIGQKILHRKLLSNEFDISMLTPGMYIVEFISDEWIVREKLIVR